LPHQAVRVNTVHGEYNESGGCLLLQLFNTFGLKLRTGLSPACMRIGGTWLLLALVGTSLLSSPVTQQMWEWDRFLRGGQDFETGSFLILVSCCLLVVLVHSCKVALHAVLAALRASILAATQYAGAMIFSVPASRSRRGAPFPPAFNLPLQI
jgi:hypothetical protein